MGRVNFRELVVIGLLAVSLVLNAVTIHKVKHDESAHAVEARHTRLVQEAGEPTGVCLREAAKAALPILVDGAKALEAEEAKAPPAARAQIGLFVRLVHSVEAPLSTYVRLQSHRYAGVRCPATK
jgi:hypothetical protein